MANHVQQVLPHGQFVKQIGIHHREAVMTVIRTVHITNQVKVAAIFDLDRIRPVWFQTPGVKPISITEICAVWYGKKGDAEVITFELVTPEKYSLEFNTKTLIWSLGKAVVDG